ncbi:protein ROOT HAIR DEFECTIVE 3 homolog 2-like [Salvia miltiorrhiza]|uniref:protein ROOT HAIR DEFECTIVE 3 homolog 2-like n=1 Tax=Salvia miltiorrhiza TaxID=226208 RepID=UPI0025ACE3BC|nr:protein ROOT HAIR DEFECTIVE 3 homolog 2-like [Salvia miltiorrhiza]
MLINGDGEFNESALDFTQGGGASIAVVAIMGPQSSGKSTLLNHLYDTNFKVMNAQTGRCKTTKGIEIAKAPHMQPLTLVLDLEGTDGRDKGEDDRTFEKQGALFALEVADTVLINMWGKDIGLEQAANRPLLRTIFQAIRPFSSEETSPRKTTLIFVVRDKPKETPRELLVQHLEDDLKKIWEAARKPKGHEHTPFGNRFSMEVAVLPSYEYRRAEFDQEVNKLKQRIVSSHQRGYNNYRPSLRTFVSGAKTTWDMIKKNKDLQVPPVGVMFATMRCEEIVYRQLRLLQSHQAWLELQQNAKNQLVKDFGKRTSLILDASLSKYDEESMNLEENVTKDKRQFLMSEALKVVHPAYMHTLGHIRSEAMQSFKTQIKKSGIDFSKSAVGKCRKSCELQFTQQCSEYAAIKQANWKDDVSSVQQELLRGIKEYAQYQQREQLSMGLTAEMDKSKLRDHPNKVWGCIRKVIKRECESAESTAVDIFGADKEEVGRIVADLKQHGANRVEAYFKDESRYVATLIRERFIIDLIAPESPTSEQKKKAYRQCLDILSTMAVIRLDEKYDDVERLLHSGLIDGDQISTYSLSSTTWEKVPSEKTLITPTKCRDIWGKFKLDMELFLANDKLYREEQREKEKGLSKKEKKKLDGWSSLPTWITVGLLSLGTATLVALAISHPPATAPLIALAATLATTAGTLIVCQETYKRIDTNENVEKSEILKDPKIMEALQNNLNGVYASLYKM